MSDVLGVGRRIDWANDESVMHRPPVVPTVATGTNMESPNVAIVFRTPQRIPPLAFGAGTAVGLSRRASRSSDGLFIDAVQLKAKDVDAFIAAAAERGIITADNVAGALLQAIGTVIDHEEASTKRAQTDRQTRKTDFALLRDTCVPVRRTFTSQATRPSGFPLVSSRRSRTSYGSGRPAAPMRSRRRPAPRAARRGPCPPRASP